MLAFHLRASQSARAESTIHWFSIIIKNNNEYQNVPLLQLYKQYAVVSAQCFIIKDDPI